MRIAATAVLLSSSKQHPLLPLLLHRLSLRLPRQQHLHTLPPPHSPPHAVQLQRMAQLQHQPWMEHLPAPPPRCLSLLPPVCRHRCQHCSRDIITITISLLQPRSCRAVPLNATTVMAFTVAVALSVCQLGV